MIFALPLLKFLKNDGQGLVLRLIARNEVRMTIDYANQPPKPQMVLPCLLSAQTTSIAVTVFLLACSVQVTASLTIPSRNPLRTCLESSQMNDEILLTPPLLASLLIAGLVIPSIEALACLFWAVLLVPTFPFPPTPLPPFPCPAIVIVKSQQTFPSDFKTQIAQYLILEKLQFDWLLDFQSDCSNTKKGLKLASPSGSCAAFEFICRRSLKNGGLDWFGEGWGLGLGLGYLKQRRVLRDK